MGWTDDQKLVIDAREGDILDLATEYDLVQKSGAWYSIDGERMGQGRENAKEFLRQNPECYADLDRQMREKLLERYTPAPEDAEEVPSREETLADLMNP